MHVLCGLRREQAAERLPELRWRVRATADPARDWDLARVAELACVTPRHLTRLFRQQAGITLMDYLGELRLALAEPLLRQHYSLEQVAERIGLSGASQLRRLWQRLRTGTPAGWRQQQSQQQR